MEELARQAIINGVDIMTVTDHVDLSDGLTGKRNSYAFDIWPDMEYDFYEAAMSVKDKLDLRIGIELGEANHFPDFGRKVAGTSGLDFVIGSTHNLRNTMDFYVLKYESMDECHRYVEMYLDELLEVAKLGFVDVLGHVGYTRRYMKRAGFEINFDDYRDKLIEIFKAAVQSGTGIEINTSGIRQGLGSTIPTYAQAKLYKDCGGEIITVGSDAHFPKDIGSDIKDAYAALRDIGFKYVAVFKSRKPEFIKI